MTTQDSGTLANEPPRGATGGVSARFRVAREPVSKRSASAAGIDERGWGDFLHRPRAAADHRQPQLVVDDVEDALDALLAEGGEAPDLGTADADGGRAEREGLEDVRATPHAAVHEDGDAAAHGLAHFRDRLDGAAAGLSGAAAAPSSRSRK